MQRCGRKGLKRAFLIEPLEARQLLAADVFISEFMASNDATLVDEDGDSSDWIEVFNAGPDDVNLDGWYVTDDVDELDKWGFPDHELRAGNFLLVYASGKDRSVTGRPLHANFRISAGGEYLALTRESPLPGDPDHVEVASEFAPDFPAQFPDISYGTAQDVSTTALISRGDSARVLFPTGDELGSAWIEPEFDDSGWTSATAAIGYQETVEGFQVQAVRSPTPLLNLTEAEEALLTLDESRRTTAIAPVINFLDTEGDGGNGNFGDDLAFPNDSELDDNDFAIRATGRIAVNRENVWTFGTSSDDGVRLTIDGQTVIEDDTLHSPEDRFGLVTLTRGWHDIELVHFERGGGAEVELFAAPGKFSSFDSSLLLVGDRASGGLRVETIPTPGSTPFSSLYVTDVVEEVFGKTAGAYLRIPFEVASPSSLESLTLRANYDDGFVAYLNGTEIARRNAPDSLAFDSTATVDRSEVDASFADTIDVSQHLGLLNSGPDNVLAIHALNDVIGSHEFLMVAELAEISIQQGDRVYFNSPTPRSFNPSTGVEGFLTDEVQLSHGHGFHDEPFELTLTSVTPGTTIRYTLDGSAPSDTAGIEYEGPILIDGTTTIRARAVKDGFDPSFIETASYIFLDDVLEQSSNGAAPPGFPSARNIRGQSLDYGMDPQIVNDPVWGPQLKEALTQVPTVSLVMDVDDLLGSRGIYTNAQSHGQAWERPASLELINPDGSEGFQVEAGVRIRGGFSRSGNNPKHAFRLFFREEYGDAKLEFPLFGDEGADEFDKIDLRTTQNYSWAFQGDGNNAFVRDVFARDAQREMEQPYTRSRYYHLYINGQYWGLYQTQERAEARYAETYFGGNADDYDVIKSAGNSGGYENEATDGNMDAYQRLADYFYQRNGLSDVNTDDYWRAQGMNPDGTRNPSYERLLDVDNLIDYMILTYYSGDRDAPVSRFVPERVNNYFAILNRRDPDGFQFFEHDSEHGLDRGANNLVAQITSSGRQFRYFNPLWMHEQLASSNTEYQVRFADAVQRHFFNDGVLTDQNAKALMDARAAEFDMAIIAESARWGDAKRSNPLDKDDWENAVSRARDWLTNRGATVLEQFRSQGWLPSHDAATLQVNGLPQHGGLVSPWDEIAFDLSGTVTDQRVIVRSRSSWRYLDDGTDQGTDWQSAAFDDSMWASGFSELGYGDGDERTIVDFGPDSNDKYRTTYFRRSFNVTDADQYQLLTARLKRDDGAVVYLNGTEVVRSNLPSGAIDYRTNALEVTGGGDESAFYDFEIDRRLLRDGANVLAVEVHQVSGTSSDISFDLELLGGQREAFEGDVYYTIDGSDPRQIGGDVRPGAIRYDEIPFSVSSSTQVNARALQNSRWSALTTAQFTLDAIPGDVDGDGDADAEDIDALVDAINSGGGESFDRNRDGQLDADDLTHLIEVELATKQGDADLDGDVDFDDFVALAENFGSAPSAWGQGNFNLDNSVDFEDFVYLADNFGFEPREQPVTQPAAAQAVSDRNGADQAELVVRDEVFATETLDSIALFAPKL